ncbi:hypothetical protein NXS19_003397 [Fusarium pseudograminearum]|nr:hypothetical protein NXS19_003397 [Fusarium pseudograminearum]
MYIPLSLPHLHGSVADTQDHGSLQTTLLAFQALMKLLCSSCSRTGQYPTGNIKRQFSDNPSKNNDIKIGLIVGFTLAAFLAIVITFLYFYYGSARFTFRKKKKNHRHQHHHHPHHPPRHRRHKSLSSGGQDFLITVLLLLHPLLMTLRLKINQRMGRKDGRMKVHQLG